MISFATCISTLKALSRGCKGFDHLIKVHISKSKLKYSLPQFGTSSLTHASKSGPGLSRTSSLTSMHSSAFLHFGGFRSHGSDPCVTHPSPDQEFPINNRLRMSRARRFKLAALGIDIGS
eukprot:3889981-Karenia_brevis.AAC.1